MDGTVNAAIVIGFVVVILGALSRIRRRWRLGRCESRLRLLAPRFVHRRRRLVATLKARELAEAIIADLPDRTAYLSAGVILQPEEVAWARAKGRLAVRTSQAARYAYTDMNWAGRRAKSGTREAITESWKDHGGITWLITSQRIVGRLPSSSEMISLWWSGLAGIEVNLNSDRLTLNGENGWTGRLSGPEVASIAVGAIAMCYRPEALMVHPDLGAVRGSDCWRRLPLQESRPQPNGATILTMPHRRRRPTSRGGSPTPRSPWPHT
jgi:hypothetical protein